MRRGIFIFILVNCIVVAFLVRSVFTLLTLLVEDASADAIHRSDLPSPNSSLIESRPQLIPKIIHQTFKNATIPNVWREAQQSCIDMHPDYEYMVRELTFCLCAAVNGVSNAIYTVNLNLRD
jgi:mannosyltransferase OCH1-like enzyme